MRASERHASLPLGMVSPPKSERDRHKSERHASLPLEHSTRLRARETERERENTSCDQNVLIPSIRYNACNAAVVKLAIKSSQWRKIGTSGSVEPAHYLIHSFSMGRRRVRLVCMRSGDGRARLLSKMGVTMMRRARQQHGRRVGWPASHEKTTLIYKLDR
ncbi:hypothetical protein EVAR_94415_1 [Eumeta japonica]|uniref:Uncharacterized protein n=1 Tax=Eumeta variegata TaxID=151549 RepID=A0A4C1TQ31_EUMVA|nr:hypothetical protein EVAR_94415_1 [Eumeta japonica]